MNNAFSRRFLNMKTLSHSRRIYTEEKKKVVAAVWRTESIQFHATLQIQHQDDLKKRMNRRRDAWQNGCHTTLNHHPTKMEGLPKTFLQIIITAKWLVRHSSKSTKRQRRPLPSLLSVSSDILCVVLTNMYDAKSIVLHRLTLHEVEIADTAFNVLREF